MGKEMKKKILIGSIIAVTLLLLMPSIPAIQLDTIKDKAYNDLVEFESKNYSKLNQQDREELYGLLNSIYENIPYSISSDDDEEILQPGLDLLYFLYALLLFIISLIMEHQVIPFIVAMIGAFIFLIIILIYNIIMFTLFDIIDILHDILVFIKDLFNLPDSRLGLIEIIDY